MYYRARTYDPRTGQFLQRDPIGFASGDLNLYAYVENDPYNWTDPSGLTSTAISPTVAVAIAGYTASVARNVRHGAVATVGMGLVGPLTRILTMLNAAGNLPDVTFNEVNDGQDNTGENTEEGTGEGDERSGQGPRTGNDEVDDLLDGSIPSDKGEKGYETPGSKEEFEEKLKDLPGADQIGFTKPDGTTGTTTTLPDGTKVTTYPSRTSNGKPGWEVLKPKETKSSWKGSFNG